MADTAMNDSRKYSESTGEDTKIESDAKESCHPVALATPGSLSNASCPLSLSITHATRFRLVSSTSDSVTSFDQPRKST